MEVENSFESNVSKQDVILSACEILLGIVVNVTEHLKNLYIFEIQLVKCENHLRRLNVACMLASLWR